MKSLVFFALFSVVCLSATGCCQTKKEDKPAPVATAAPTATTTSAPTVTTPIAASAPIPARSMEVQVKSSTKQYTIVGKTEKELRAQLDKLGPQKGGKSSDGYTEWFVKWSYPFDKQTNVCALGKVAVTVDIVMTMPKWDPPAGTSPDLINKWNRYMESLTTHENGHRDHGVTAAEEVFRELSKLAPARTCPAADSLANTKGKEITAKYKAMDESYDKSTVHGKTQGARFP